MSRRVRCTCGNGPQSDRHYLDCYAWTSYFQRTPTVVVRREYGLGRLLLDVFLTFLTSGLWLVWLLIKFLRNGRL